MPNPAPSFYNTKCDECEDVIYQDDNVYFHDGEKLCQVCACDNNLVCECGNYKKSQYPICWDCKTQIKK